MTAWNKTVTNSVNFLGCPADLWNAYNWNAFKWGSGTADLPTQTRHLVTNALAPTEDELGFAVRHLVTNALAPSISQGERVFHLVTNSLTPTEDEAGFVTIHLVTNSLTPTEDEAGFVVRKQITNSITLTATDAEILYKLIANSLSPSDDVIDLYLQDSQNYFHVFPEGVVNGILQTTPSWSDLSPTGASWATAAVGSTTWSN